MIVSFRHGGLRRLYERGERQGVPPQFVNKLERILARLDVAATPADMDIPGFRLHRPRGQLAGHWSVRVSGNWRVVFGFRGADACDVNLVDYH